MRIHSVSIIVSILIVITIFTSIAVATYDKIIVNTSDRTWILNGAIKFQVEEGSTNVNGVGIEPGDNITIQFNNVGSNDSESKVWIGNNGWIDIIADSENITLIVNNNEVASGDWELDGIRINISSLESSLTLFIPSEDPGWTKVVLDGDKIIYGESSDEIKVIGIHPSINTSLNLNLEDQYLKSAAISVEINGQEVPIISLQGMSLMVILFLVGYAIIKMRR